MIPTPAQIANNPQAFASTFLKILDKDKRLVPLRWNRAQAHFHANRTGRDIILKARQLGFSTYVQGELFRRAVTSTRTTMTMAHDDETTQKMRTMADRFWDNCKFGSIQPARKYANASVTTYPEFDSEVTIGSAGGKAKGRGGTYTDFHGSEVAFWPDAEKIVAGAMQGGHPDVILESTPNGAQGYFYELCMGALRNDNGWKLHFYAWWWDDDYRLGGADFEPTAEEKTIMQKRGLDKAQIRWRRSKQVELKNLFLQEYPEDVFTCFLTSGNSYFGDLSEVFIAPLNPAYDPTHEYNSGLDFGQSNDYTVLSVYDKTAKCQVDFLRINKMEWKEIRRRVVEVHKKWNCKRMGAESNSIGSVNIEAIRAEGVFVVPFETTNASKADIMSDMNENIHAGGWKMQDYPVQRHEMNTFISSQSSSGVWRLAASGDGHDDTVIANAISMWVANNNDNWHMVW